MPNDMAPSRCVITGNGEAAYMYLGRPWEAFGRVVFAETFMDHCIEPVGRGIIGTNLRMSKRPASASTGLSLVLLFLIVPEHECYLNFKMTISFYVYWLIIPFLFY